MKFAKRVQELPPYLFAEISRKIAEKKAQGARSRRAFTRSSTPSTRWRRPYFQARALPSPDDSAALNRKSTPFSIRVSSIRLSRGGIAQLRRAGRRIVRRLSRTTHQSTRRSRRASAGGMVRQRRLSPRWSGCGLCSSGTWTGSRGSTDSYDASRKSVNDRESTHSVKLDSCARCFRTLSCCPGRPARSPSTIRLLA